MFLSEAAATSAQVYPSGEATEPTVVTSSAINSANYRGICYMVPIGTMDAETTVSIVIEHSDTPSGFTTVPGATREIGAAGFTGELVIFDIFGAKQYTRASVTLGATAQAGVIFGGIYSFLFGPHYVPTTGFPAVDGVSVTRIHVTG